jgi:hypothetical protein
VLEQSFSKDGVRTGTPASSWEDLVVAILSVNQYSLERTYGALPGLREQKVIDPFNLVQWETEEIEAKLRASGCDRGSFMTALFAKRLSALGALVKARGVNECEKILESQDTNAIEALLLPVKGIGPVVLRNFYSLREIKPDKLR